jgi:hypothetical protein
MLGPKFSAVQSGNSDTQYSVTWFDSSDEPYILHLPDMKGRYYTFQLIDAFTNNFHAGWCLLVSDHVRRQEAAHGRELARPLQDRERRRAQGWLRRLDYDLHPGRLPGKDKESNWLPAPKEPFYMLLRMYLPNIEGFIDRGI